MSAKGVAASATLKLLSKNSSTAHSSLSSPFNFVCNTRPKLLDMEDERTTCHDIWCLPRPVTKRIDRQVGLVLSGQLTALGLACLLLIRISLGYYDTPNRGDLYGAVGTLAACLLVSVTFSFIIVGHLYAYARRENKERELQEHWEST